MTNNQFSEVSRKFLTFYPVRVTTWYQLFLEFWLVHTWIFAHWRHQRAVTHFENVRQLNESWGKKLDINLLHKQPLFIQPLFLYPFFWNIMFFIMFSLMALMKHRAIEQSIFSTWYLLSVLKYIIRTETATKGVL